MRANPGPSGARGRDPAPRSPSTSVQPGSCSPDSNQQTRPPRPSATSATPRRGPRRRHLQPRLRIRPHPERLETANERAHCGGCHQGLDCAGRNAADNPAGHMRQLRPRPEPLPRPGLPSPEASHVRGLVLAFRLTRVTPPVRARAGHYRTNVLGKHRWVVERGFAWSARGQTATPPEPVRRAARPGLSVALAAPSAVRRRRCRRTR